MIDYTKTMLRVNGVPIQVAVGGGPNITYDDVGIISDRSVRGGFYKTQRGIARIVTCKTIPYEWNNAINLRNIIDGRGANITFDELPFTINRALAGTASAGSMTLNTSLGIAGAACAQLATGTPASYTWSTTAMSAWLATGRGTTINMWVRTPSDVAFTLAQLQSTTVVDTGIVVSRAVGGALSLACPGLTTLVSPALTWGSDWHMVTAVARATVTQNYPALSLYFDGVLVAQNNTSNWAFTLNNRHTVIAGPGSATAIVYFDELLVLPGPLTHEEVAGLYDSWSINAATSLGAVSPTPRESGTARYLPMVFVTGDGMGDGMIAAGRVVGMQYQATFRDPVTGGLLTNAATLDLQFVEAAPPR